MKNTIRLVTVLTVGMVFFLFVPVFAVDVGLNEAAATGLTTTDIRVVIAGIIRVFLGLLGMIALGIVLYAGFTWMTAGGAEEKIANAKKTLINGLIGLVIVMSAYGIAEFTFYALGVGGPGGAGLGGGVGGYEAGGGAGALGGGVIESHYPGRGAVNVPRNTKIMVTFKEEMDATTVLSGGRLVGENVKISRSEDTRNGPFINNVSVNTVDNKTFVLDPDDLLGDANGTVKYTVALGRGLKKANGQNAFGNFGGYQWEFEVSTIVDTVAPKIVSVIPSNNSTDNPRNSLIQVTFSEAVDPTTISGTIPPFANMSVISGGQAVAGKVTLGNQYTTAEYLTDTECGKNSCGGTVFCLPGGVVINVNVVAATLKGNGPEAQTPYSGVVDLAGNSLDGNGDGVASGALDSFAFSFQTNNNIDLVPPVIQRVSPVKNAQNVFVKAPISSVFSKVLMASSVNTSNIALLHRNADGTFSAAGVAFWVGMENQGNPANTSEVFVYHDPLVEQSDYTVEMSSDIRDQRQNCFNPSVGP